MPLKSLSRKFSRTIRGATLFEALLSLAIGGMVLSTSTVALMRYTTDVKVQATATVLNRLNMAADRYADDNFEALVAAAPQSLDIDVLEPYYGAKIHQDALGTTYTLTTRSFDITGADPTRGTIKKGLQVLVIGEIDEDGPIAKKPGLRADVANTAGGAAGYISVDELSCQRSGGAAMRNAGDVCGSFGSYSFDARDFPQADFDGQPFNGRDGIGYVSLVTKSREIEDTRHLYRYDMGDPELNAMSTDIEMNDYNINDVKRVTGLNGLDFDGGLQNITTDSGALNIQPMGNLSLAPASSTITLEDTGGAGGEPKIAGTNGRLQLGVRDEWVSIGPRETDQINGANGRNTENIGSATLLMKDTNAKSLRAQSVNSLHSQPDDQLILQNRPDNGVIVGKRVRYAPSGAGTNYEISDGEITTKHTVVQDISCADCGGNLSNILPKWRHMGTYFIQEDLYEGTRSTFVPYPECGDNRRGSGVGTPSTDDRFEERIIVTPKSIAWRDQLNEIKEPQVKFNATKGRNGWNVTPTVKHDFWEFYRTWRHNGVFHYPWLGLRHRTDTVGKATALAATYCVFVGGNTNPTRKAFGSF